MAVRSRLSASGPGQNDSWENISEVRSEGGRAALNISRRILDMGCPYISGMEPSTVREVLFSVGEARVRILQWLVSRFHSRLQETVQTSGVTSMIDIPSLTMLLSSLGLCSPTDYDLIKGILLGPRQLQLMETLLDLVDCALSANNISEHHQAQQSCFFLDALCRQEDLSVVFPSSVTLLTPDLPRSTDQKTNRPSLAQLHQEKVDISQKLDSSRHALQRQVEGSFTEVNPAVLDTVSKSLSLSAITLAQTTGSFVCCYDNELRPWSNKEANVHQTLGPAFKRLHKHTNTSSQLLNSLELLEDNLANIQRLQRPVVKEDKVTHLSDRADVVFKECRALLGMGQTELNRS